MLTCKDCRDKDGVTLQLVPHCAQVCGLWKCPKCHAYGTSDGHLWREGVRKAQT